MTDQGTLYVSKEAADYLKGLPKTEPIKFCGYEFPVIVSPLLPVETSYDACDVVGKHEIKIPSGEFIHAFVVKPEEKESPWMPYSQFVALQEAKRNHPANHVGFDYMNYKSGYETAKNKNQ